MASRVLARWQRRARRGWMLLLAGWLAACTWPSGPPTPASGAQNLVATHVALALTQTALAPTVIQPPQTWSPPTLSSPTSTPTQAPTPTWPPTPNPGPCAAGWRPSSPAPTPGDWDAYRGYVTTDWILDIDHGPRGGFLLGPEYGGRSGFSIEVYEAVEPDHLVFFLQRQVCRDGDRPAWEVTDVLVVPYPTAQQAVVLGPGLYDYQRRFWAPGRPEDPRAQMGAVLGLTCVTPLPRPLLALIQAQGGPMPSTYNLDTRVSARVVQAWHLDLERTQRFVPVDLGSVACEAGYVFGP